MCREATQMDWNGPLLVTLKPPEDLKVLMDKYIPKTKPGKLRKKRPPYMTRGAIEKVKKNCSKHGEYPGRAPTTTDMQGHETKLNGNAGEQRREKCQRVKIKSKGLLQLCPEQTQDKKKLGI